MKSILPLFALAGALALQLTPVASAQEKSPPTVNSDKAQAVVAAPPTIPDQKKLEEKFIETLTRATMSGRWSSLDNGKLGPEKEEKYVISGVNKVGNDLWLIHARVQYGTKDVTMPVPVYVKWAGDTAVISITDASLPGLGTYTARVLIYGDTYAGTWSGGKHAGMLHGVITRAQP